MTLPRTHSWFFFVVVFKRREYQLEKVKEVSSKYRV